MEDGEKGAHLSPMITPAILYTLLMKGFAVEMILFGILPLYAMFRALFSNIDLTDFLHYLFFRVVPMHYLCYAANRWSAEQMILHRYIACDGESCDWLFLNLMMMALILGYFLLIRLTRRILYKARF